jgi:hypothetical protein
MMEHAEYKRGLLADPAHPTSDMLLHVGKCRECTEFTERLMRFENRLDRALRVETSVPASPPVLGRPARWSARMARPRRLGRGLAVAASVLVAVVIAGGLWLSSTGSSLAADVVGHMSGEPNAWTLTDVAVPSPKLAEVMGESNLRLKPGAGLVSYASSCSFRGHQVPHLVVQTAAGPVTVMVLTHEHVRSSLQFDEQGYRGMIIPVRDHGSLAVLERDPKADPKVISRVAADVLGAIEWNAR